MDDKGHAKIPDFGLAKLLMPNQSKTFTVKADIYSFGIMLFEIVLCCRNVEVNVPDNEQVLVTSELQRLVPEDEVDKKLERVVKVGLCCTQNEPSSRPTRKKAILMLEGTVNIAEPPCPSSIVSSQSMQSRNED
ncbi:hypothetical protein V6N13_047829 [Hibiscus sabdariffa]